MSNQNTPTNTLEEKVRDIIFEYGSTNKSVNLGEAKSLIMELISEAVNKAQKEAEYWRKRASKWKKEVERLDGKLMNYELNKTNTHMEGNETPKGDK